jgi:dTDP-4-amino-4,6-dideoxygalactose transaminase
MQQLERELRDYLRVPDVVCLANGTCAMQLAIRALDLEGEIITTPFSFIATANIIAWERCTPVFVDIDPDTWNIDPLKIEDAITPRTVAILPVHVFSAPCDVVRIQEIADRHGLKVIYDAAHAMAVECGGQSVLNYGDISCVSFHATKLFNTCEGGACVSRDPTLNARIRRMRFFGFNGAKEIVDEGLNAKMTEISAALGLANLRHLDGVRLDRTTKGRLYRALLTNCPFITFQAFKPEEYNYSYMPMLFDTEGRLLDCLRRLEVHGFVGRRYFFPSLHWVEKFASARRLRVADHVARRSVCLPLHGDVSPEDIEGICGLVNER